MKTKTQYGLIKATPSLPVRDLLRVPHKEGVLVVSYPAFGSNCYSKNLREIQRKYYHSKKLPKISFRDSTTSESISVVDYDFENETGFLTKFFDQEKSLQIGRILSTSEGVFANPPKDAKGKLITDERALKSFLTTDKKSNGIYLLDNDFGFAPYETFKLELQNGDTFAQGGLARVLEHTKEKTAKNLRTIVSRKSDEYMVFVSGGFDIKGPTLLVASLSFHRYDYVKDPAFDYATNYAYVSSAERLSSARFTCRRLNIECNFIDNDVDGGDAFGVLDSVEYNSKLIRCKYDRKTN